jgi:hypothetical protein
MQKMEEISSGKEKMEKSSSFKKSQQQQQQQQQIWRVQWTGEHEESLELLVHFHFQTIISTWEVLNTCI